MLRYTAGAYVLRRERVASFKPQPGQTLLGGGGLINLAVVVDVDLVEPQHKKKEVTWLV